MPRDEQPVGRRHNRTGPLQSLDPVVIRTGFDERRQQMQIDSQTVGLTDEEAEAYEADLILQERALRVRLLPSSFPPLSDAALEQERESRKKGILAFGGVAFILALIFVPAAGDFILKLPSEVLYWLSELPPFLRVSVLLAAAAALSAAAISAVLGLLMIFVIFVYVIRD